MRLQTFQTYQRCLDPKQLELGQEASSGLGCIVGHKPDSLFLHDPISNTEWSQRLNSSCSHKIKEHWPFLTGTRIDQRTLQYIREQSQQCSTGVTTHFDDRSSFMQSLRCHQQDSNPAHTWDRNNCSTSIAPGMILLPSQSVPAVGATTGKPVNDWA